MNRHFRQIDEFEDYYVSNNGTVYSKNKNKYIKHNGKYITLWKDGKKYVRSLSKILNLTFAEIREKDIIDVKLDKYKEIEGFEHNLINKNGDIFSKKTGKLRKQFKNPYGYKCIFLSKNGKNYNRLVHRLVYETWIGDIPNDMTVDHIDENKLNNNLSNLQLLTRSDNVLKFHKENKKKRVVDGYIMIEDFDNYYVNKDGHVISFKYGDNYHNISVIEGRVYLRKDNKRYGINMNYLMNKYFNENNKIQENRKYSNIK